MERSSELVRMQKGLGLLGAVVVMVMAWAPAQTPAEAKDKVERFLELVLKADSLGQISRAYERGAFSATEVKRIEAEVAKPAFQTKLASLSPKHPPVLANKLEVTRPAAAPSAKGSGGESRARSSKVRPVPAKLSNAPAISPREVQAITSRPGGGTEARISGVEPSSFGAGRTLAISGGGFGRQRGSVEILYSGRRYICDLTSWGDSALRAVVPEYMAGVIGDRAREALLWVKLAGRSLGPTFPVRLEPSPPDLTLPE